jgi:hypothetical protein
MEKRSFRFFVFFTLAAIFFDACDSYNLSTQNFFETPAAYTGIFPGGGQPGGGGTGGASANANLAYLNLGSSISFSPTTYSYSVVKEFSTPETLPLSITAGAPGQLIMATFNGAPVNNGDSLSPPQSGSYPLVVIVTAPDGITRQTYTISYTYRHGTQWYVSSGGSDATGIGTLGSPYATVTRALQHIRDDYYIPLPAWPGKSSNTPVAARINISGTINENVTVSDSSLYYALPPIILAGSDITTDKIDANSSDRPLRIDNAAVILEAGLSLTGGNTSEGGGVRVAGSGSFTMNEGSITGNTVTSGGGGVYVYNGGSFSMNGGSITGNTAGTGGGVLVILGSFSMNGGTITLNTATISGGGVYVSSGGFAMNGGRISENKAISGNGGGVYVSSGGSVTMSGGSITLNTANSGDGGGVSVAGGNFTMNGGSIDVNTASSGGGGVYVSSGGFAMNGGSIDGNTATSIGGGVSVSASGSFSMNGGSVSGNTVNSGDGGGVRVTGSFIMSEGTITGNTATSGYGGGVNVTNGTFTMSGGTITGNTAAGYGYGYGGGVHVVGDSSSFTMSGGTITGNTTTSGGGGVYVGNGSFIMSGSAAVDTGNPVGLSSNMVITLSGALTANPAANIVPATASPGTQVLGGSHITTDDNYRKFWLNGVSNKIGTSGEILP